MAYSGMFRMGGRETAETTIPEQERQERRSPRPSIDLGSLFQKTEAVGWETDDLLLALVFYLMYRESGDKDLLIMLAVMFLT